MRLSQCIQPILRGGLSKWRAPSSMFGVILATTSDAVPRTVTDKISFRFFLHALFLRTDLQLVWICTLSQPIQA